MEKNKAHLVLPPLFLLLLCLHLFLPPFFFCYLVSVSASPRHGTPPSPPHNPALPLRAARHRAVLYFFAHFSQRLVPSHVRSIPCYCAARATVKKEGYIFPLS